MNSPDSHRSGRNWHIYEAFLDFKYAVPITISCICQSFPSHLTVVRPSARNPRSTFCRTEGATLRGVPRLTTQLRGSDTRPKLDLPRHLIQSRIATIGLKHCGGTRLPLPLLITTTLGPEPIAHPSR